MQFVNCNPVITGRGNHRNWNHLQMGVLPTSVVSAICQGQGCLTDSLSVRVLTEYAYQWTHKHQHHEHRKQILSSEHRQWFYLEFLLTCWCNLLFTCWLCWWKRVATAMARLRSHDKLPRRFAFCVASFFYRWIQVSVLQFFPLC